MTNRLAITCPYCKRPMATSPAFSGQVVACPHCRGEFPVTPPVIVPPGGDSVESAAPQSPPAFRLSTMPPSKTTTPPGGNPQAALVPQGAINSIPVPPPKTARFKVAQAHSPGITPTADGKLPSLQLADAADLSHKSGGGDKSVPLWIAVLAVMASTLLSAFLLLYTPPEVQSVAARQDAARRDLTQYYGGDAATLRPFQLLLREAQQAHSRGDEVLERDRYRAVLRLLRAEGRGKFEGLTGTPDSDAKLAQLLAILLADY